MELIILFSAWLLFPLFLPQNTVNALSDFLGCFHLLFKLGVRLARGEGDGRATDHPRKVQVFAGSFFNRISSHFLFHVSLVPKNPKDSSSLKLLMRFSRNSAKYSFSGVLKVICS